MVSAICILRSSHVATLNRESRENVQSVYILCEYVDSSLGNINLQTLIGNDKK